MKWKRSHVQTSFVALPQITSQMKSDCFLKFFSHPSAVNTCRCDNRYKDLTDLFQKKNPFRCRAKLVGFACVLFCLLRFFCILVNRGRARLPRPVRSNSTGFTESLIVYRSFFLSVSVVQWQRIRLLCLRFQFLFPGYTKE